MHLKIFLQTPSLPLSVCLSHKEGCQHHRPLNTIITIPQIQSSPSYNYNHHRPTNTVIIVLQIQSPEILSKYFLFAFRIIIAVISNDDLVVVIVAFGIPHGYFAHRNFATHYFDF